MSEPAPSDERDLADSEGDLALLFAPPLRWGYEFVPPKPAVLSPERNSPPRQRPVRMVPRAQAAGLREAAVLALLGAVGAIALDGALGLFSGHPSGAVVLVHLAAGAIGFRVARAWQRSRADGSAAGDLSVVQGNLIPAINAILAFSAPYFVLPLEAVAAWLRIAGGKLDLVPDPTDRKQAEAEYAAAVAAWQQRIEQFEQAEKKRYETVDLWYPVGHSPTARMVCAFGGTPVSWAASLWTLGASMLGAGARVLVGDLSRRPAIGPLLALCRQVGVPAEAVTLPDDAGAADLFAGLGWKELSTLLVEVLHAAVADPDASHRERHEDRTVIRDVARCLADEGGISIGRLREALLVVEGANVRPGEGLIDPDEYDRLAGLYNAVQREHGGVLQRVTRIEHALRDLQALDDRGDDDGAAPHGLLPTQAAADEDATSLRVVAVDKRAEDLDNDRLVDVVFQLLLRQVRTGSAKADVLVILGADRIRRAALEGLVTQAEHDRLSVVLFFEHLRQDAVEVVGVGGAAAAFFALGNHREAKEASEFIGADYEWVESQRTHSEGESLTKSWTEEFSHSRSHTYSSQGGITDGWTQTEGSSRGEAQGETKEQSQTDQRVREFVIQPEVLMGLPATSMICVEVLPHGRRVAKTVDCHPRRRFVPRVATEPRPLPAAP